MTKRLIGGMVPMFLLLIASGCFLVDGIPTGNKAVRDLPYIMMCAYQDQATSTGIIAYDELTLDYSNCDRPGETLLKQCPNPYLPRWSLFINGYCQWNFYSRDRRALHNHLLWNG